MPNSINGGDGAIIRAEGVAGDQQILNIWGFKFAGHPSDITFPTDADVAAGLNAIFQTAWRARIVTLLSDKYECMRYFCGPIAPWDPSHPNSWTFFAVSYLAGGQVSDVGGITTPALDSFSAVSVQLKTAHPGKTGRGSKRLGPIVEGDTDFNEIEDAELANWRIALANFLSDIATAAAAAGLTGDVAVNSFKEYKDPAVAIFAHAVTSEIVNKFVGSQVSRKSYLRGH